MSHLLRWMVEDSVVLSHYNYVERVTIIVSWIIWGLNFVLTFIIIHEGFLDQMSCNHITVCYRVAKCDVILIRLP